MSEQAIRANYDVAVVGAGPAGMTAASVCARAGLATVLFDEQAALGGQVYRGISEVPECRREWLGADYQAGEPLAEEVLASGAQYVPGATVWSLNADGEIGISLRGGSQIVHAAYVVLATGALERPFPIPGWTLPGVMTAGAAQVLLKSAGLVPAGATVLAGTGPLIWLLARQLLQAGGRIDVILDTTPRGNRARARPHAFAFLRSPYFGKGLALLKALRGKVRIVKNVTEIRAEGNGNVARVAFRQGAGAALNVLEVDSLLLHQGVVPEANLAMSAGIAYRWNVVQLCWTPVLGASGESSLRRIFIAGDAAGIAGAEAAAARGVLAASAIVRQARPAAGMASEASARASLARFARGRAFLDQLYQPARQFRQPEGDTIVCRCEEITAAQIAAIAALGCPGPNQMKSFLRCGMGPCQGRLCGLTVTELIAMARHASPQEVGHYRVRPPVKPVTVAELASVPSSEAALRAVVRSEGLLAPWPE